MSGYLKERLAAGSGGGWQGLEVPKSWKGCRHQSNVH